jgi:hypothetical protein
VSLDTQIERLQMFLWVPEVKKQHRKLRKRMSDSLFKCFEKTALDPFVVIVPYLLYF